MMLELNSIMFDRTGKNYSARKYKIIEITSDIITGEYLDDNTTKLILANEKSINLAKRIHENIVIDREKEIKKSLGISKKKKFKDKPVAATTQTKYYFTLGYICRHGFLGMRTVGNTEHRDGNRYHGHTNVYPWEEKEGYISEEDTSWATKIWIRINPDTQTLKQLWFPGSLVTENDYLVYYDLEWGWSLIERGFRLGRVRQMDKLRDSIPKHRLNSFEEGLNS